MTLFSTLNQSGIFCLNLLLGVFCGGVESLLVFLSKKIKRNEGLSNAVEITLYVVFAIFDVIFLTTREFIDFGFYIPLSFLFGILLFKIAILKVFDFKR